MDVRNALVAMGAAALVVGCGDSARLDAAASVGPNPPIPAPNKTLVPTVHVAEATGWKEGAKPTPALP